MFIGNNDEYTICNICRESTISSNLRCQNCRARLPINYISHRNRITNINLIIPIQRTENESLIKINNLPVKEELKDRSMTIELYNKGKNGKLESPLCVICQDNIEYGQHIYLLSCKHFFHKNCAKKWFYEKSECPYCRKKFILVYK